MSNYVTRYQVKWRVNGTNASFKTKDVGLATTATLGSDLNTRQTYDVRVVSIESHTQIEEQFVESIAKYVSFRK